MPEMVAHVVEGLSIAAARLGITDSDRGFLRRAAGESTA